MDLRTLPVDDITVDPTLGRTAIPKDFLVRLEASINSIGLAEPLKVAALPDGPPTKYVVIDGQLRLEAVRRLRAKDPNRFTTLPAYVMDFHRRFEIRFQTDLYQDLLPSQLAQLVEHLHKADGVSKGDIAAYIGVSPATLRNYTGLWRLIDRGGLFRSVVHLMDVGALPASNPFAWLRLSAAGIRYAIETHIAGGETAERWVRDTTAAAERGEIKCLPLKTVERVTGSLPQFCYRGDAATRGLKRSLGERRRSPTSSDMSKSAAIHRLATLSASTKDPVVRTAAENLRAYLQ